MALKAMVKTLDGLPDAVKPLYRRDGEGDKAVFVLDVEPADGFALENVAALKATVLKTREERDTLSDAFKGLDAAKARDALAKVEAMKNWTPEEKVAGMIEARTKELAAAKDAELGTVKQQLQALETRYRAVRVDAALTEAARKAKFVAPHLASKLFGERVGLNEALEPVVLGTDGKPVTQVNNDGSVRPVTIDEFVASMARHDDYKDLVAGNNATGTQGTRHGASGSQTGTQDATPAHVKRQYLDAQLADELMKLGS